MRMLRLASIPLALCVLSTTPLHAQARIGIKATYVTSGSFYCPDCTSGYASYSLNTSYGAGAFVDLKLGGRFVLSPFLDVTNLSLFDDQTSLMWEPGVALKLNLGAPGTGVHVRPLIGVGFAKGGSYDIPWVGDAPTFGTARGGVEVSFGRWFAEGIAWGAPFGGNSVTDATFGAVAKISLGFVF